MKSAPLPSGAVAFLFSDIEGSTRRWDAYGEAMRDAVRRHDAIVRAEIERRRGYVFKTIGDAFCAAFWSVPEALDAAVEAQRALGREDFDEVDGLLVRMAIHAGTADERDGDYFGTAVNRTARLLSAGHGGQILVSGNAADMLSERLSPDVELRRLGTLPLRDLKEPEHVYQPIAAELRADFKPLRALETPPNNLPQPATSFVGRARDVSRIEALLETESLVTIVGAGGMGKTRLALEAAAASLNDWPDGAWFVDLASLAPDAPVSAAILSALRADQTKDVASADALLEYLEGRELLLLLDNCEHVVAGVARVVAAAMRRCSSITFLATSREALDVAGEYVYPLSTLDLSASVQLFAERARAADRRFSPEADAAAVEEICRRLDGIALAIELAAARVRAIPIRKLAEHLELRLLAGGRDRQPRQQTMRALIDWSYDLLAAREREILRHCAVCTGGFTLESAIALYGTDYADTLELLSSLVEKSLLLVDSQTSEPRYRLLEPIRQYALEKLEENGEVEQALRRHAHAYAALARDGYEEWDTSPAADWLERLARELPNLRAAIGWTIERGNDPQLGAQLAADAAPVFLRLSLLVEGVAWCERVLAADISLPAPVEARLRYGLSMLYQNKGASGGAFAEALEAVSLYREAGDSRGLARALSQAAHRYVRQDRYDEARAAAQEALRLARDLDDPRLIADVLRRCALAFATDGMDRVRERFAQSVALFRKLGRDDETARALTWWGESEAEAGNYSEAAQRLLEAKRLAGDELAVSLAGDVAACYLAIGDRTNAEPLVREALQLAARLRHPIETPFAISYAAALAGERDAGRAARLMGYAEERLRAAGWQRVAYDRAIADELATSLERQLGSDEFARLLAEGAAWTEDEAVAHAMAL